ncbi:arginine-binding periplasmic protein-like [Haliotis asinina]|uniref:arginine-binding periplasmic protein-like n=1 Tax=Haliotis asinina TaxID=109174 RepID=UPI0035318B2D
MARLGLLLMTLTWALSAESQGKVWIFSVSANRRPFNYADEIGKLVGFDLDLINKVCSTAGVKCAPTVQPFSECIQTVDGRFFPGRGLMSGWFDACMGYTITQERVNAVQFTNPYIQTYAKFTVKPGNPRGVNLNTLSQAAITHLNGAYTNQQCLNRLNYSVSRVVVAPNLPVAKELVLNGTVDAAFSPRSRIPDLETLDITLHCDLGGVAVMVTKGSTLPDWWNPAYEKIVKSGEYQKLCEAWRPQSTSSIKCFEDASHAEVMGSSQTKVVVSWCLTATMLLVSLVNSGVWR